MLRIYRPNLDHELHVKERMSQQKLTPPVDCLSRNQLQVRFHFLKPYSSWLQQEQLELRAHLSVDHWIFQALEQAHRGVSHHGFLSSSTVQKMQAQQHLDICYPNLFAHGAPCKMESPYLLSLHYRHTLQLLWSGILEEFYLG